MPSVLTLLRFLFSSRYLRRAVIALLVIVAIAPLAACSDDRVLTIHTEKGTFPFTVEVANTDKERAQGLMFRDFLAPNDGMLFDFLQEKNTAFWMRNTLIPLDMIFIGSNGIVKNVHVNARPLDPTAIPSDGPVQFVLEIPGGRSLEIGLKSGDKIDHTLIMQK